MAYTQKLARILRGSTALLGGTALLATAPSAQAQMFTPQGGSVFGLFSYIDTEGPGQIQIADQGPDPATGGERIGVQIAQNGMRYLGSGFELQLDKPNVPDVGFTTLVVFTVRAPDGQAFQFRGKIRAGSFINPPVSGSGAYEQAGTGVDLEQWTFSGR